MTKQSHFMNIMFDQNIKKDETKPISRTICRKIKCVTEQSHFQGKCTAKIKK